MNTKSAMENLQKITREKEAQMKTRRGSKIVEKNRSRRRVEKSKKRRHVEYLVVGYKVVIAFIIIFEMCKKEVYNEKIQFVQMII
jgi:hypothetical protein